MGNSELSLDKKKIIFLIVSICIVIIGALLPSPEGLSNGGKMTLVLLLFAAVMWIGNVLPKSITAIAAIIMLPFFGCVESLNVVYSSFVNSIFFFLLGIFGLATVIQHSNLPSRIMVLFFKWFGNNSRMIIFAFGATTFLVSAFMSDLAAAALIAGIVLTLSDDLKLPKRLTACLFMIVPFGAMSGGVCMPISSPTTATIMQLLQDTSDVTITFLQWMVVGIPAGIVGFLISWLLLIVIIKPEKLDEAKMAELQSQFHSLGKMDAYDKKALAMLLFMLIAWIAGTWIKVLDSTFVALVGLIIMFLPGVNLLKWETYQKDTPFDLIFMLGAMFSMCAAMTSTGTIQWIIDASMGNSGDLSPLAFTLLFSTIIVIIRAFIPNGAPVVVMITPAILGLANQVGVNPLLALVLISIWSQMTYLVPIIDAVWQMTYYMGKYKISDVLKVGIPLTVIFVLLYSICLGPLADFSLSLV